jgi:hypothetical protein
LRSFGSSTRTALFFFLRRNFAYQIAGAEDELVGVRLADRAVRARLRQRRAGGAGPDVLAVEAVELALLALFEDPLDLGERGLRVLAEDGLDSEGDELGDLGGRRAGVLVEGADLGAAGPDRARHLQQRDVLDGRRQSVDGGLVFEQEQEAHGRRVMVGRWAMSTMTRPTISPKSG